MPLGYLVRSDAVTAVPPTSTGWSGPGNCQIPGVAGVDVQRHIQEGSGPCVREACIVDVHPDPSVEAGLDRSVPDHRSGFVVSLGVDSDPAGSRAHDVLHEDRIVLESLVEEHDRGPGRVRRALTPRDRRCQGEEGTERKRDFHGHSVRLSPAPGKGRGVFTGRRRRRGRRRPPETRGRATARCGRRRARSPASCRGRATPRRGRSPSSAR